MDPLSSLLPLCLACLCLSPVEGRSRVVGSPRPILATVGDDVVLPCHVEPALNLVNYTVAWSKGLVDPQRPLRQYVHVHQGTREDPKVTIGPYVGRTAMFPDGLRNGNISLRIANVTQADQGQYQCFVPGLDSRGSASVYLTIEPKASTPEKPPREMGLRTSDATDPTDPTDLADTTAATALANASIPRPVVHLTVVPNEPPGPRCDGRAEHETPETRWTGGSRGS